MIDGTIARRPLSVALENPYIRIALDAQPQRHHHPIFDMRFRAIFRSLAAVCSTNAELPKFEISARLLQFALINWINRVHELYECTDLS